MDSALVDRTTIAILGVTDGEQPLRPMTIPGIEGKLPAKTLSTDLRGSSTRLARFAPGWGSALAGAFSAHIEVFVIGGSLQVGPHELDAYHYVAIPRGGVVTGLGSTRGGLALLMTSGPVRYDTSTGGAPARLVVGRPSETSWARLDPEAELFSRPLARGPTGDIWIGSSAQDPDHPVWHRHPHDEECLVLGGEVVYVDRTGGEEVTTHGGAGSYFYRPAGSVHTAPCPVSAETVLTFHRSFGRHQSERVDDQRGVAVG